MRKKVIIGVSIVSLASVILALNVQSKSPETSGTQKAVISNSSEKQTINNSSVTLDENIRRRVSYIQGYSLGQRLAKDFRDRGALSSDLMEEMLITGIRHGLENKEIKEFSDEQARASIVLFWEQVQQRDIESSTETLKVANNYLADVSKKKDIIKSADGVFYERIKEGDKAVKSYSELSPELQSKSSFILRYRLLNRDNVVIEQVGGDRVAVLSADDLLPGLLAALQTVKPGEAGRVYLSPEQAFGAKRLNEFLGPNDVAIYEVELIDLKDMKK